MNIEHVAIILDGNRRWAKERNLPTNIGHKEGMDNLEKVAKQIAKKGVKYLTVYAFSTENWNRSKEEVGYLMKLFKTFFTKMSKDFKRENIKVNFLSKRDNLTPDLLKMINESEEVTKDNTGMNLNICFNYGGRTEIVEAVNNILNDVKNGSLDLENTENIVTEDIFKNYLYTKNMPDPDIMIRTSGESRLSNFLPWQLTYSEYFFIPKYWPDFSIEDFEEIVESFEKRDRRFGAK